MEAGLESGSGGLSATSRNAWAADKKKIKELEKRSAAQGSSVGGDHGAVGAEKKADLIWGSGENE